MFNVFFMCSYCLYFDIFNDLYYAVSAYSRLVVLLIFVSYRNAIIEQVLLCTSKYATGHLTVSIVIDV